MMDRQAWNAKGARIAERARNLRERINRIREGDVSEKISLLLPEAYRPIRDIGGTFGANQEILICHDMLGCEHRFVIESGRVAASYAIPQKRNPLSNDGVPFMPWRCFRRALGLGSSDDNIEVMPATLAEAHARLERDLWAEKLAEIDRVNSEGELDRFHVGEDDRRYESASRQARQMMIGLRMLPGEPPTVRMPDRSMNELRARFLAPYRGGVFVSVRTQAPHDSGKFVTEPYFFSSADKMIHKVRVPELRQISSALVVGNTFWCAGVSDGASVLLGVDDERRTNVGLPTAGSPPQLGLHGHSLLAVYHEQFSGVHSESPRFKRLGPEYCRLRRIIAERRVASARCRFGVVPA